MFNTKYFNKILSFLLLTGAVFLFTNLTIESKSKPKVVEITTEFGTMKIVLYDETPLHRDNFVKLTKEGFYKDLLFHRVIKDFMIQGGDPDSRNAKEGAKLGEGGPGYTIPAEFNEKFYHKKGVLAAARQSDAQNPLKESSGSQFYIVQGKKFTGQELIRMEQNINMQKKNGFIMKWIIQPENIKYKIKHDSLRKVRDREGLQKLSEEIDIASKSEFENVPDFKFTEEQKEAYKTIGGTPHLDGAYTVFGEVIEGLDVLDKIAAMQCDKMNRPLSDIKFSVKIVK